MKISLEWLTEYLPGRLEAIEAGEALTHGGLPVEVFETIGDDMVIDVEVTSNRGDCLSHVGIARELGALLNRPTNWIEPLVAEANTPVLSVTSVQIQADQLCPHYTARMIRGVKVGPSPAWMQKRLEAIGVRPINNVVDVTNYVMFEMGQPLHAFDFDRLEGGKIIVRNARAGELMVSIDGHERKLMPDMLVIADASRPVALAGVMGGRDSEVSEKTVNVLLESARFDPLSVRTTSRRLALKSDSSYRFERGIDPALPRRASLRATQLILETAGGEVLAGVAEAGEMNFKEKKLSMRLDRLHQLLGLEIPAAAAFEALWRLQLNPVLVEGSVEITVPSWRSDLNIEVDLIEETARVTGYDKIPVRDEISICLTPPEPQQRTVDMIRSALVGSGYFEAISVTFVTDKLADDFTPQGATLPRADVMVRKADAKLRPSLLPGLLEAVRRNETVGTLDARLFEMGSTFVLDSKGQLDERRRLGLAGVLTLRELRGAVELLLGRLDATRSVSVVPGKRPGYAADACGEIRWGAEIVGYLGEIDRSVRDKVDLRGGVVGAELELAPLLAGAQHVPQLQPLPRFPAIRRDVSLVVAENTPFDAIRKLIDQAQLPDLEDVEYIGCYRGKPLDKGSKSLTISLVFRSRETTLTSQNVDSSVQRVVQEAAKSVGAVLRA